MTPDEYEARLRRELHTCSAGDCRIEKNLNTYADWLRLRAVAGVPCYVGDTSLDQFCQTGADYERGWPDGRCAACTARRRMAEILAAAEVTT